jgi:hypothetical protein
MSKHQGNPALESAIAETFGRTAKHTSAELAAIEASEVSAEFRRLTSSVTALAVTRLGMSEQAAVRHAEIAAADARQHAFNFGRIVRQSADPSVAHRHLQRTADKLRATVSLAAGSARKPPSSVVPVVTREQTGRVIAEAFGRPGRP